MIVLYMAGYLPNTLCNHMIISSYFLFAHYNFIICCIVPWKPLSPTSTADNIHVWLLHLWVRSS